MRLLKLATMITIAAASLSADALILKNGKTIIGTYLGGSPRQVKFDCGGEVHSLDVADVLRIDFNASENGRVADAPLTAGGSVLLHRHKLSHSHDRRSGFRTQLGWTDIRGQPG